MKSIVLLLLALLLVCPAVLARTIEFSGLTWEVRGWGGAPGNGCWSDGEESVWVDELGRLHLVVREVGEGWCQAEVRALVPADYGDHTFQVMSRLDQMDPDVVLGMFLYDRDGELDIEITGAFESIPNQGWFTIYGFDSELVAQKSFEVALSGSYTTHEIRWLRDRIAFQSWHGHCDAPPCGGTIHSWVYDGTERLAGELRMQPRINLWIHRGGVVESPQEVIISSYTATSATGRRRSVRPRGEHADAHPHLPSEDAVPENQPECGAGENDFL